MNTRLVACKVPAPQPRCVRRHTTTTRRQQYLLLVDGEIRELTQTDGAVDSAAKPSRAPLRAAGQRSSACGGEGWAWSPAWAGPDSGRGLGGAEGGALSPTGLRRVAGVSRAQSRGLGREKEGLCLWAGHGGGRLPGETVLQ